MSDEISDFESYPRVVPPPAIATQVADVYSLYQDFVLIAAWCEMIEETDTEDNPDGGVITLGLWRAACITYRRCWDPTGRSAIDKSQTRMNLLDSWLDQCGIQHARDTHQRIVKQADKNAAHRVDDSEQYQVAVFLAPSTEPPAVKGVATFAAVLSAEMDLVPRLVELAVLFGEVVLEDAGWCCPSERSVVSVVIVEVDEPVVGHGALAV